jgi:hypothetical protein
MSDDQLVLDSRCRQRLQDLPQIRGVVTNGLDWVVISRHSVPLKLRCLRTTDEANRSKLTLFEYEILANRLAHFTSSYRDSWIGVDRI